MPAMNVQEDTAGTGGLKITGPTDELSPVFSNQFQERPA